MSEELDDQTLMGHYLFLQDHRDKKELTSISSLIFFKFIENQFQILLYLHGVVFR